MSSIRKQQSSIVFDVAFVQLLQFFEHGIEADNHTIANEIGCPISQNTTGEKVKRIFLSVLDNSMPSIGSTIEASTNIVFIGENVDQFTLALVTPLSSQDNCEFGSQPIDTSVHDRHDMKHKLI
jgi:hypothetical protein